MRSKLFIHLLCPLLLSGMMISGCSNDDNSFPGPAPKNVNGAYFSGGSASGKDLVLKYNNSEWAGKEARFQTSNGEKATVTLKNIVPGEELATFEVDLAASADEYSFQGTTTTATGCKLSYDGTVRSSLFALRLNNEQPANPITGTWNLAPTDINPTNQEIRSMPLHITWEASDESASQIGLLLSSLGSAYLQGCLQSVSFGKDGNITASYRKASAGSEWTASPSNLCLFYYKNETIHVSPDIRMITAAVQQKKAFHATAPTKAVDQQSIVQIITLLPQVLQWGQEGIPFHTRQNDNGTLSVFLDKATVAPLIALLPTLAELLPVDESLKPMIDNLIGQMTALLPQTTRLEIGIDLSK